MSSNPLLQNTTFPHFNAIEPRHVEEAVAQLIKLAEEQLKQIEELPEDSFDALYTHLDTISLHKQRIWMPIVHLQSVSDSDALRAAFNKVLPQVVKLELQLDQNETIYRKLHALAERKNLTDVQRRIVDLRLRRMDLEGVSLRGEAKKRFNAISQELSQLSEQFANNDLDAVKKYQLVLDKQEDIAGLPAGTLQLAAQAYRQTFAREASAAAGPWLITLEQPSFVPFMEYSTRRDLRERLYRAQIARAAHPPHDNSALINKILRLRKEAAAILRFPNFAAMNLSTKMAGNPEAVKKLLDELQGVCHPKGKEEHAELTAYAHEHGFDGTLQQWDVAYWARRMKEERFDLDKEKLRRYFPLPKVLEGMFTLAHKLFGIRVQRDDAAVARWHEDVSFYRVYGETGEQIAAFFLDPYSRPQSKRGGAWMNRAVSRRRTADGLELPACYIVCNFTPPLGDEPAMLDFYEVITLFHEFGHGLHNMLTTMDYAAVAGGNGVEWDAIELPSQFMENFCYLDSVIKDISAHVDSGESLPATMLTQLQKSKNFRVASAMLRQLSFSRTDLQLHENFDPDGTDDPFALMRRVMAETQILPPLAEDRFLCSFAHIFAGGYAAGYYSYKWAEVLSADAFALFKEHGLNDEQLRNNGRHYRDTILAPGGSAHPAELFKRLRGRPPRTVALLEDCELV